MIFWCQGAGLDFDYALKLVPWYERVRGCSSLVMIDSGVKREPPEIAKLAEIQIARADVAVAPDVLGDPAATDARTEEWLTHMASHEHITRVVCTQGTIQERICTMLRFKGRRWAGV